MSGRNSSLKLPRRPDSDPDRLLKKLVPHVYEQHMIEDRGYNVTTAVHVVDDNFYWRLHGHSPDKGTIVVVCVASPSRQTQAALDGCEIRCDKLVIIGRKVAVTTKVVLAREGIEMFSTTEMVLNPVRVRIAPDYRVLSSEEKEDMFQRLSITEKHLPLLQSADKVVRHLGLTAGDVVRVTSKFTGMISFAVVEKEIASEAYKPVKKEIYEGNDDTIPSADSKDAGESGSENSGDEMSDDEYEDEVVRESNAVDEDDFEQDEVGERLYDESGEDQSDEEDS